MTSGLFLLKIEWIVSRKYDSQLRNPINLSQKSGQLTEMRALLIILINSRMTYIPEMAFKNLFNDNLNFSDRKLVILGILT